MYPSTILQVDPVLSINEEWSNKTNILTNDDSYATSKSGVLSAIEVGNFGFNVASGCEFSGIEVNIKAKKKCASCSPNITVYAVINNSGIKTYTNIGVINTLLSDEQGFTLGGENNLLGLNLTSEEINNFSLALVSSDEVMVYDVRVDINAECPVATTPNPSDQCNLGYIQIQSKKLINPLLVGETLLYINDFNSIPETYYPKGRELNMSDTGGDYIYATINEGTRYEENVKITSIDRVSNGVVMDVVRGIRFTKNGSYSDINLQKSHSSGSSIVFSNSLPFYQDLISCATGDCCPTYSATDPTSPAIGDQWYNTNTNVLSYWNGSIWVSLTQSGISAGVSTVNGLSGDVVFANATVSGQTITINGSTYVTSPTAPTSPTISQVYYNTTTNQLLMWNGTSWVAFCFDCDSDLRCYTTIEPIDCTTPIHTINEVSNPPLPNLDVSVDTFTPSQDGYLNITGSICAYISSCGAGSSSVPFTVQFEDSTANVLLYSVSSPLASSPFPIDLNIYAYAGHNYTWTFSTATGFSPPYNALSTNLNYYNLCSVSSSIAGPVTTPTVVLPTGTGVGDLDIVFKSSNFPFISPSSINNGTTWVLTPLVDDFYHARVTLTSNATNPTGSGLEIDAFGGTLSKIQIAYSTGSQVCVLKTQVGGVAPADWKECDVYFTVSGVTPGGVIYSYPFYAHLIRSANESHTFSYNYPSIVNTTYTTTVSISGGALSVTAGLIDKVIWY